MSKENGVLFAGSRRLWMPNDPNGNGRKPKLDNGTARFGEVDSPLSLSPGVIYFPPSKGRERLPISALPPEINFAEYVPSGNGIGPEHLAEALGHLNTGTRKLIINADPQECQELLLSLSRLFQAHYVGHLMVAADGLKASLGLPALVTIAEMWHVPILMDVSRDGLAEEAVRTIRETRVPVALGVNPGSIYQNGFQIMNI